MSATKQRRGRPADSSIYKATDHANLARMADLIAKTPELKPDTAMARIGIHDETVKRRLRRRWKKYGAEALIQAQGRLEARRQQTLLEEARRSRVQVPNPSSTTPVRVPGDALRLLDQLKPLGTFDRIGTTFQSLVDPLSIASRLQPYQRIADHPGIGRLTDALGPRQDFAALKNVMGPRPDAETLRRLYNPGGTLDLLKPGKAFTDMFKSLDMIGDTFRRKP